LGAILGWAVVSAFVGTILSLLRTGKRGARATANMAQLAWGVATYFVIPVIMFENEGPLSAIRRSTSIMKRTWRESLAGSLGMGLVFLGLILLGLAVAYPVGWFFGGVIGGVVAAIICLIVVLVFSSAANAVLIAALYRLARTGKTPAAMEESNYQDFGSMFEGHGFGSVREDATLTADQLTLKYAR